MPAIKEHWEKEGIKFSAIYTGYLGSAKQIEYVKNMFDTLGTPDCKSIVDPVMGDNGKLYPGFDSNFVDCMRTLAFNADYIIPNITEACFLTGTEYRTDYDETYINTLLEKMHSQGARNIVLTGVSYRAGKTGVVICAGNKTDYYEHELISKGCHGTGDVYASAFVGALMSGKDPVAAASIAADFTVKCIENTQDDPSHWYGVKFEPVLQEIIKQLRA